MSGTGTSVLYLFIIILLLFFLLNWNHWNGIYLVGCGGMDGKTTEGKERMVGAVDGFLGSGDTRGLCLGSDIYWKYAWADGSRVDGWD